MRDDHFVHRFDGDLDDEKGRDANVSSDDLPPDLAELACQLSDDAAFLSARFPAARFPAAPGQAAKPDGGGKVSNGFALRLPWAAAVLFAAVGTGLIATDFVSDAPLPVENARRLASGAAVKPVVAFDSFTGAEQEAVLDLLEDEGVEVESFSI
jgi:hypothetical protein